MKGKHKKSCNRFDYGGAISQQVLDLYRNSSGNGIAGAISTSLDDTQKQANNLVRSAYNFNPVAANNDELMDIFSTNRGLQNLGEWKTKDTINNYGKNTLSEISTGSSIGGPWGTLVGLATGPITAAIQQHNIKKDIASTNELISELNQRQVAANNNAANNLATRQKLGFEAGYFRDGGDINYFNNGGTHEQNPYGGIPQGVAPNNQMNVVEEGEVKWESPDGDYIFSNHQRLNKKDVVDNLLPNSLKGKTIASATKSILKESDERPYDYISTNGKYHFLNILRDINESKNPQNQGVNSFVLGGEPETEDEESKEAVFWGAPLLNSWRSRQYPTTWGTTTLYTPSGAHRYDETERARYHGPLRMNSNVRIIPTSAGPVIIGEGGTNLNPAGAGSYSGVRGEGYAWEQDDYQGYGNSLKDKKEKQPSQSTPSTNTATPTAKKRSIGVSQGSTGAPATKSANPPVTSGGDTPQAAAGEPVQPEKKYDFGPAFTDPFVTARSRYLIEDALKSERNGVLSRPTETLHRKPIIRHYDIPEESNGKSKFENVLDKIGDVATALAPAWAAAFDNPNYNYANEMRNSFRGVNTPYVSSANYMKYTPIDLDYIFNQINRQSQNNMSNIMDLSGGNRATAMAGLFGNDFNTQIAKGNALLQADLQNMQNYQNVQKHNTGINEFDINQYTTNSRFNAQGYAQARQNAAMMGQQEYDAWKDREYANLSQALTNLQGLKKDRWINDQIQMLVDSGAIVRDPRTGKYVINNNTSV